MSTFLINLTGAGLLGLLVARLARRDQTSASLRMRLLLGTGLLGGFTTYSALAVDTVLLVRVGAVPAALTYAMGTVLFACAATWLGLQVGRRGGRP